LNIAAEIAQKVKLIELRTRQLVTSLFAGEYHSAFKGQGMTFAEFREYVPGDDVRDIAWKISARTGKTFIKKYDEERELSVVIAVDVSGSFDFGSTEKFKGEVAAYLAALLGFSADKNNDHIGLLLFSNQIEHYVPPKKGHSQMHRLLRDLFYIKPSNRQTKISVAMDFLQGVLKKRSMVFVISDFMDKDFGQSLRYLAKRHEVVAVVVSDPFEYELPNLGLFDLEDPETGEVFVVDTSQAQVRKSFQKEALQNKSQRNWELSRAQVDTVHVQCGEDVVSPLVQFFRRRYKR
jgi:uncharacterized protein (DUF58 family)